MDIGSPRTIALSRILALTTKPSMANRIDVEAVISHLAG
jgi:hypothetical protein